MMALSPVLPLAIAFAAGVAAQRATPQPREMPPVSMTCPMHPDVVEATPGSCPICRMRLVPVRLEAVWTCPVHAVVANDEPGRCPICRRDLVQMTVALTWTCANRADIDRIDRGTCPDGTPMIARRTLRPHGNHNPQHGGQFFMAPDNFHHLEGTHPRSRVFRLYLYDDYARPLPRDRMRLLKARVVTNESFDPSTGTTKELATFPLKMARNGAYLEARVDSSSLPAQMTAKVRFKEDAPEYRFDFTFTSLSKEPTPPASRSTVVSRQSTVPSPPSPVASPQLPVANPPAAGGDPIPDTVDEILAQLKVRHEQIGEIVQRGDFGAVWVPAFQAKDLAVALEDRVSALTLAQRNAADQALRQLVRTAWLLDALGDVGNRQQIVDAYALFRSAVDDVMRAFEK
jgi:hypothetical protein